jgi:hypothetical protein
MRQIERLLTLAQGVSRVQHCDNQNCGAAAHNAPLDSPNETFGCESGLTLTILTIVPMSSRLFS